MNRSLFPTRAVRRELLRRRMIRETEAFLSRRMGPHYAAQPMRHLALGYARSR